MKTEEIIEELEHMHKMLKYEVKTTSDENTEIRLDVMQNNLWYIISKIKPTIALIEGKLLRLDEEVENIKTWEKFKTTEAYKEMSAYILKHKK